MRVLLWSPLFAPETGGIETITAHLATALQRHGHEFVVITSQGRLDLPTESSYAGIPVYRFPLLAAMTQQNLSQIVTLRRQITAIKQAFQPQLVHLQLGGQAAILFFHLQTGHVCPAPSLITIHDTLQGLEPGSNTVLGRCLAEAAWVVANSTAMWQDAEAIMPGLVERMSLLPCALPAPPYLPQPLNTQPPRLLCLGRITADKGFDLAIDAFAQIAGRYPTATLTIVGEGPARQQLQTQIDQLGLQASITLTGWVTEAERWRYLNQATLLLVPSRRREAFGLVALEAAQMARPVIATRAGGLTDVVVDQQTGLLVEPESALALATALDQLLGQPALLNQLGQAAYQRTQTVYDWPRYGEAYDQLYRRFAQPQNRPRLQSLRSA
ncbi:MAG: glycosyltransferase family 4 protein [Caldilineaceae bacterium]|nr:glycosyltransferase family 4 protein [Caldilineaceae bacterium]